MKKIILISFPRSGSNILLTYITNILLYIGLDYSSCHCHELGHCNTIPCSCINATITKAHDFDLNHQIQDEYIYIVNMRKNKLENIESYIRYVLAMSMYTINDKNIDINNKEFKKRLTLKDLTKNSAKYYKNIDEFYDKFKDKYTIPRSNMTPIYKEDIEMNPRNVILTLIEALNVKPIESIEIFVDKILSECVLNFAKFDENYFNYFTTIYQECLSSDERVFTNEILNMEQNFEVESGEDK